MSVWVQVKVLGKFALADKEGKLEHYHRMELVFFKQAEMVLHLPISSKKGDTECGAYRELGLIYLVEENWGS